MDFNLVKDNLEKKGYDVSCFSTKEEASQYLNTQIDGTTVGRGGSVSLHELGIYDELVKHNEIYWHHLTPKGEDTMPIRRQEHEAKIYICSVNAIAKTGEIINIDGVGNRLASMFFGHEKIYFVVGKNKIAEDYESALWRARNIAAPKNAQRLGVKTPCAIKADHCYDCKSPERICRGLAVLWEKMTAANIEVILIDEELGY